jgi:hypothetical protein
LNISVQSVDVIVWPKCLILLSLKSLLHTRLFIHEFSRRSLWGFIKMALWSLEPILLLLLLLLLYRSRKYIWWS